MSLSQQALATLSALVSTLSMYLGLKEPACVDEQRDTRAQLEDDIPFRDRPRVLVVDDHLENRLLLEALLYKWSIAPVHAADGAEAVALACGQHFDLILMDLQMPVLDGLTATTQIRGFERRNEQARAPIVAYSSSTLGGDWPVLRTCGFDESLEKPCSSGSLEACLLRWCGSGRPRTPPLGPARRRDDAVQPTRMQGME